MTAIESTKSARRRNSWRIGIAAGIAGLLLGLSGAWLGLRGFVAAPEIAPSLLEGDDLIERIARFAPVLDASPPASLDALLEVVERFEPGPQEAELALFTGWWAEFDPRAALVWARAAEEATGLPLSMSAYRAWARQDPRAALADANATLITKSPQLLNGAIWQDPGLQAVLVGWDESGQAGLEQWIFETEHAQERQGMMSHLARQRIATRPAEEVWNWALNLSGSLSDEMLPRVASALAAKDPVAAAQLAEPLISHREFPSLPRRIATRWVRRDPATALEWLAELPEGSVRRDGVLETARTWLSFDPPSFMAYVSQRVESFPEWLDPAFELYTRTLASDGQPRPAIEIAKRLRNENRRAYTMTLILRMWLSQDQGAAESWMEENQIDPGMRTRARHPLRRGQ